MIVSAQTVLDQLTSIVGKRHVLTEDQETRRYRMGYRFGNGRVLAVVCPGNLVEQWRVVKACIAADKIIIMQAANTGLTGGSTPDGDHYDRDVVLINTLRMKRLHVIGEGKQVICLPGATLDQLEKALKPYGREPHSVIGSSCIGASVLGGVCNNSGGSLVQRGPAFTQLALYARITDTGEVQLVNHLGVSLGDDAETILARLEQADYQESDIDYHAGQASDHLYHDHVRQIDAETPARFNADPSRLFEASGCAGKLVLFAVRLDSFPIAKRTKVFYIGTNNPDQLTAIRRHILQHFKALPVAGEYMHREAYRIASAYGKDVFLAIRHLGTDRIPLFFNLKSRVDAWVEKTGIFHAHLSDRVLQGLSRLFPHHLPKRMEQFHQRYEHHLLLKMADDGIEEASAFLKDYFQEANEGDYFECTPNEGSKAFLHRFAAAGAAVRYRAIHDQQVEDIIALDIALKRNEQQWTETLPAAMDQKIITKLYYGHFFCHVFHQDYIVKKGHDCHHLEQEMLALLDEKGAEYPAEHNVGHLYAAKPALKSFYQALDPSNALNPGIGQTSRLKNWR